MPVRILFLLSFLVSLININFVFNSDYGYLIEKTLLLTFVISIVAFRPFNRLVIFIMICAIFLCIILALLTEYPYFQWVTTVMALNQLIIFFSITATRPTIKDSEFYLKVFSLLPLMSVILGSVYHIIGIYNISSVEFSTGVSRLQGSLIPAYLSGLAMCGLVSSTFLAFNLKKSSYWIIFSANLIISLLSGGRSTLAVAFLIMLSLVLFRRDINFSKKFLFIYVGITSIPFILFTIGKNFVNRIFNSGSNNRDVMWDYLLHLHDNYSSFGIGLGHQYDSTPYDVFIRFHSNAAHNEYLRFLVELGTVGSIILFIMIFFSLLSASKHCNKIDYTSLFLILGLAMLCYTENVFSGPYYYSLILVVSSIRSRQSWTDRRTVF